MSSDLSLSASHHGRNSRFIQGIIPVSVFTAFTFILDKAKPVPRGLGFFIYLIIYNRVLHIFSLDFYFSISSDHRKIILKWTELVPLTTSLFVQVTSEHTGVMFGAVRFNSFGLVFAFCSLEIFQILSQLRAMHSNLPLRYFLEEQNFMKRVA